MPFDYDKVKDILVCPRSKADLVLDECGLVCVDPRVRSCYPIVDDIPRLLTDEATELTPEEWAVVMLRHNRNGETGQPLLVTEAE
jgi:uncharacterized protein